MNNVNLTEFRDILKSIVSVMYRDFDGCTFELSIRHKKRNHLNLNSMKTLIFSIAFVLNLIASVEVNAQHTVNNNLQFKVEGTADCPLLLWNNKKEMNTSYYIIEYSFDNINYKTLCTRKALGQSNFPANYSFSHVLDSNVTLNQMRYYRVVLVLMGGNRLYSETKAYIPVDSTLDQNVIANLDK